MELKRVSLEIAKKLKEIGFDLPTRYYYRMWYSEIQERKSLNENDHNSNSTMSRNNEAIEECYSKPTLELVKMWFRKEHKIYINNYTEVYNDGVNYLWQVIVEKDLSKSTGTYGDNGEYQTYEEALETAILKAIEIVKE